MTNQPSAPSSKLMIGFFGGIAMENNQRFEGLAPAIQECEELTAILAKSVITAKQRKTQK